MKAAVLNGDNECPDLVASSVYDTKPVHYLSMSCEELKWQVNTKAVFNVNTGKMEQLRFLRMNHIHEYNGTMGNEDVAEQLRGSYHLDLHVNNRKWWWSIMYWALGVILTNAYIVYRLVHNEEGTLKSEILSHHDFNKEVAFAWISYKEYKKEKEENKNRRGNKRKRSSITAASSITNSIQEKDFPTYNDTNLRMTDNALDPKKGIMRCRLVTTYSHLPEMARGFRPKCQLHRWSGKS